MKSIKMKISLSMILTVAISLCFIGMISIYLNYSSTNQTLEQTMTETAKLASQQVSWQLQAYKNIAMDTGRIARLSDPSKTTEDKKAIIDQAVSAYGLARGNIIGTDGISIFDGKDYSDREYVQQAFKGESFVSEPLVSKITGELSIMIAAPIWKDGVPNSQITGVVYFVPKETFLNEIVMSIQPSPNARSYVLNEKGTVMADFDSENIKNQQNLIQVSSSDSRYNSVAEVQKKMIRLEEGFELYKLDGKRNFLAYSPIEGRDGWSLGVTVPENDFLESTILGMIITGILLAAACLIAALIAWILSKRIGLPIQDCTERIKKLAKGDLKTPVPQVKGRDETRQLADATGEIVGRMNGMITDISWSLGEMAAGNFNIESQAGELYVGDFGPMADSMSQIMARLSDTLYQINQSAEQVSSGSNQVSAGAQALSQGATEQASSVEELASTISEIADRVKNNAVHAQEASDKASIVGTEMAESNAQMNQLMDAMGKISQSSGEIGKIMKTIEDIAFQTNILALNAAVEAARAGQAGRGFAIVADEVRNLANKSSEASKSTSSMIEESLQAIENGTMLAGMTARSLETAVEGTQEVVAGISQISEVTKKQAQSISQVTLGVDQISSVVQTNSATAEQSAAASEELSSQAQMLKNLVGKFQLRENPNDHSLT